MWDALSSALLSVVRKNLPEWSSLDLLVSTVAPQFGVSTHLGGGPPCLPRQSWMSPCCWSLLLQKAKVVMSPRSPREGEGSSLGGEQGSFSTRAEDIDDEVRRRKSWPRGALLPGAEC